MYATIRRYKIDPKQLDTIAKRISGAAEVIGKIPGFKAYYAVRGAADTLATVSVFNDRAGAEKSTETAAKWVKENLPEVSIGTPEVTMGEVMTHK